MPITNLSAAAYSFEEAVRRLHVSVEDLHLLVNRKASDPVKRNEEIKVALDTISAFMTIVKLKQLEKAHNDAEKISNSVLGSLRNKRMKKFLKPSVLDGYIEKLKKFEHLLAYLGAHRFSAFRSVNYIKRKAVKLCRSVRKQRLKLEHQIRKTQSAEVVPVQPKNPKQELKAA